MKIGPSGGGFRDLRQEPYRGKLAPGDWVEYDHDFRRNDDFFSVPAGIERLEGRLAYLINLRGDVTSIDAEVLKKPVDNPIYRTLPAFDLVSVPGLGAAVEIATRTLGDNWREMFEGTSVRIENLKHTKEGLHLATIVNGRNESRTLGLGHLKRADLPQQIARLLARQNQELCSGAGLGAIGNALMVGGVRLAMRSAR